MSQLPKDWQSTTSGEMCEYITSGSRDWKSYYSERGPLFVRTQDINQDCLNLSNVAHVDLPANVEGKRSRIQPGDLLVTITGANVGKVALVPDEIPEAYVSQSVGLMRLKDRRNGPYLHYYLQSDKTGRKQLLNLVYGIGRPVLSLQNLRDIPVSLPPLPEQRQIVAEIEKQFTRLEVGVNALRRAQANLKRYRAAVLKAACEGQLVPTEAELNQSAGQGHKGFESGEQLLKRILVARRQNWTGPGKYKEPKQPDTANLAPLPPSWTWVSWEMVLASADGAFKRGPFGSALTKSFFVEKGFKVYEQYCPINDDCSFGRYYITPEKFEELKAFEVKAGDYLISCSGVTLGRITRVPEQYERGVINQALLRVRLDEKIINHRYFLHLFRSAFFQKAIFENSTGSAIPNVKGVKELKAMAIPLPSLAEQTRIVAEVERRLSVLEELESMVTANLQRATRLRQSILQKAFSGELL